MKIQLFSAAVLAFASSAAYGQAQAVQWRMEDGGNGHWYQLHVTGPVSWPSAKTAAEARGGHLATITSQPEQALVRTLVKSVPGFGEAPTFRWGPWLGGYQDRNAPDYSEPYGGWRWVSGEAWFYTSWNPSEPNNLCFQSQTQEDFLSVSGNGAQNEAAWNDLPSEGCGGDQVVSFVVEWSADCNGDGIVDYGQCRDGSLPDYNGNNIPDCCESGTPCVVGNYPVQWRVEDGGNGHWYAKVASSPLPTTISAMQGFAASRGADLASIASAAENQKILTLLESIGAGESFSAWIGLYRAMPGDPWRWTDGSETTWVGWGGASCGSGPYPNDTPFPGELGTVIYRQNCGLVWDDSATAWIQNPPPWWGGVAGMTLILEWSADCNNDGIVDYGQILSGQLADVNGNGVPDSCDPIPCLADVNNSGAVNGVDLAIVLGAWGTSGQADGDADINDDGIVNGQDLAFVLGGWGPCP